jgi:MFS family permease
LPSVSPTGCCVRDFPHEKGFLDFEETASIDPPESGRSAIADLLQVLKYRNTRLLFFIPGGIVGSVLTFSGLWGVPFLTKLHQISAARAGALTSLLMVAMAVGGPFFGWLSDRLGNRKKLYLIGCGVSIAGWIMLLYPNGMPIALLVTILLITGFSSGAMIISFAFVKESVPARLGGTVSGVINMGVMIGPMLLQPAVGWVLDRLWTGEVAAGVRVYSANSYRWGFSIMLAWVTLSWILLLFTRETGCRQGD